jgi:hypothetical protein
MASIKANQIRRNINGLLTAQLPFFLTWEMDLDFVAEIYSQYLSLLEASYLTWLNNNESAEQPLLRELYSSLEPSHRFHFLSTPGVSSSLLQHSDQTQSPIDWFFNNYLFAEFMGLHQPPNHATFARIPSGAFPLPCRNDINEIRTHPSLRTAKVREFVIDIASAFCFPSVTSLNIHSDQEVESILKRLMYAFDSVESVNKTLFDMIQRILRMIVIRKDKGESSKFSSSSWPGLVGTIALTNAHHSDIEDARIIDAIVHESIHSLLYIVEYFEPFYNSDSVRLAFKAVSPWSGSTLYLHSYVHACFVWFGLWCFWSLAIETGQFSKASVGFFQDRSCQGFLGQNVLAYLGDGQFQITETVRSAIRTMQEIVIRSCHEQRES